MCQKVRGPCPHTSNDHSHLAKNFCSNIYATLENADCLLVLTEWSEFRTPDFTKVLAALKDNLIFDGRNVYDLDRMKELGFQYISVGRPRVKVKSKLQ